MVTSASANGADVKPFTVFRMEIGPIISRRADPVLASFERLRRVDLAVRAKSAAPGLGLSIDKHPLSKVYGRAGIGSRRAESVGPRLQFYSPFPFSNRVLLSASR